MGRGIDELDIAIRHAGDGTDFAQVDCQSDERVRIACERVYSRAQGIGGQNRRRG